MEDLAPIEEKGEKEENEKEVEKEGEKGEKHEKGENEKYDDDVEETKRAEQRWEEASRENEDKMTRAVGLFEDLLHKMMQQECSECIVVPFHIYATSEDLNEAIYREPEPGAPASAASKDEKILHRFVLCVPKRYFDDSIHGDAMAAQPFGDFCLRSSLDRLLQFPDDVVPPLYAADPKVREQLVPVLLRCLAYLQWHLFLNEAHPNDPAVEKAVLDQFSFRKTLGEFAELGDYYDGHHNSAGRHGHFMRRILKHLLKWSGVLALGSVEQLPFYLPRFRILWNVLNFLDANSTRDHFFFTLFLERGPHRAIFWNIFLQLPVPYAPFSCRSQNVSAVAAMSRHHLSPNQWRYVFDLDARRRAESERAINTGEGNRLAPISNYCLVLPDPVGQKRFTILSMAHQLKTMTTLGIAREDPLFSAKDHAWLNGGNEHHNALLLVLSDVLYDDFYLNQLSASLFRWHVALHNHLWRQLVAPRLNTHSSGGDSMFLCGILQLPVTSWSVLSDLDEAGRSQCNAILLKNGLANILDNADEVLRTLRSAPDFDAQWTTFQPIFEELRQFARGSFKPTTTAEKSEQAKISSLLAPKSFLLAEALRLSANIQRDLSVTAVSYPLEEEETEQEEEETEQEEGTASDSLRYLTETLFGAGDDKHSLLLLPVKLSVQDHFPYLKRFCWRDVLFGAELPTQQFIPLSDSLAAGASTVTAGFFWCCMAEQVSLLPDRCDFRSFLCKIHSNIANLFAIERLERRLPPVYFIALGEMYRMHWDDCDFSRKPVEPIELSLFLSEAIKDRSHYWTLFSVSQYIEFFGTNRYTCLS